MLDRLLHHAQVFSLKAASYRMKERLRVGAVSDADRRDSDQPPEITKLPREILELLNMDSALVD